MRALAFALLLLPAGLNAQLPALAEGAEEPVPLGRIATPLYLPHECLAPVEVSRIDGEDVSVPARGFSIEPGFHSFNGRALLDTRSCRGLEPDLQIPPAADLAIEVEAGKAYYVAYDRSSEDPRSWRLVVWKVEDVEPGENADPVTGATDNPEPGSPQ